jgi:hypothetical protein
MAFGVVMLFVRALNGGGARRKSWLWFGLGVLVPFLVICAYNLACFGTAFTTNYQYENPMFVSGTDAPMGVFLLPDFSVLAAILFSPFRGLFIYAPILVMGIVGLVRQFRAKESRADAYVAVAMIVFLLLFNMMFNGWSGGWAAGPRYLVPALPFMTVPIALAYRQWRRTTNVLLAISAAVYFVITAVDAQPPVGAGGLATVPGKAQWKHSLLLDYELPLMFRGQATPVLNQLIDVVVARQDRVLTESGKTAEQRKTELAALRSNLERRVRAGAPDPLFLATIRGPVSVNPIGIYEGTFNTQFAPSAMPTSWNSFNVGEFLVPRSLASLLPLLVLVGWPVRLLWKESRA